MYIRSKRYFSWLNFTLKKGLCSVAVLLCYFKRNTFFVCSKTVLSCVLIKWIWICYFFLDVLLISSNLSHIAFCLLIFLNYFAFTSFFWSLLKYKIFSIQRPGYWLMVLRFGIAVGVVAVLPCKVDLLLIIPSLVNLLFQREEPSRTGVQASSIQYSTYNHS